MNTMTNEQLKVLVAFPVAESMRAFLRATNTGGMPLPSLYRVGAENRPCGECGMTLNVGPRLLAVMAEEPAAKLVCPLCLLYVAEQVKAKDEDITTIELGNPESGWEGETEQ